MGSPLAPHSLWFYKGDIQGKWKRTGIVHTAAVLRSNLFKSHKKSEICIFPFKIFHGWCWVCQIPLVGNGLKNPIASPYIIAISILIFSFIMHECSKRTWVEGLPGSIDGKRFEKFHCLSFHVLLGNSYQLFHLVFLIF